MQHRSVTNLQGEHPAAAGSGNYSRTPELRISHKMAERKRRSEMKQLFDELNGILPNSPGSKSSKWEILTKCGSSGLLCQSFLVTNVSLQQLNISEAYRGAMSQLGQSLVGCMLLRTIHEPPKAKLKCSVTRTTYFSNNYADSIHQIRTLLTRCQTPLYSNRKPILALHQMAMPLCCHLCRKGSNSGLLHLQHPCKVSNSRLVVLTNTDRCP
jgi:hypothetical protein